MLEQDKVPSIIREVGFGFSWDERKVWSLDVPTESIALSDLAWHFDVPFLWNGGGIYNLTPRAVIEKPDEFSDEYQRTMRADLSFPIDIMENKGRWLILDGLHRLMKASILEMAEVNVRRVSREFIPLILKSGD